MYILFCRSLFELWGSGRNHDELEASVNKLPSEFTVNELAKVL